MADPLSDSLEDQEAVIDSSSDKAEGKRSTRTSFKLSEEAIEAKDWLTSYYDISQKDLLEIALEILEEDEIFDDGDLFKKAEESLSEKETARKTYVVTQKTKEGFTELAEEYEGVSRDALVETAIKAFQNLTEMRIDRHEEVLDRIQKFYDQALELEGEIGDSLGTSDPVRKGLGRIVMRIRDLKDEIEEEVENKTPIDVDLL